jgi:tetratricopeptide (TPR) repeat protein
MKSLLSVSLTLLLLTANGAASWSQPSPNRWVQTQIEARQALEQQPLDLAKLQALTETALNEHQFEAAIEWAQRILKQDPNYRAAHIVIVKADLALGRVQDGRTHMDQVIQLGPEDPESAGLDGMLCLMDRQVAKAAELFQRSHDGAKRANMPKSFCATAANSWIASLHTLGESKLALEKCSQFLVDYPDCPELYVSASRLYRDGKQYQQALDIAKKGVAKFPNLPNLYASIALAESALGHKDKSEEAFNHLLRLDPPMAMAVRAILDGKDQDKAQLQVDIK